MSKQPGDTKMINDDQNMKLMYGEWSRRVPAWMYVQDSGEGHRTFVGATASTELSYSQPHVHQLIMGEIIVRPHFAVSSNAFRGYGLTGLAMANHADFLLAEDLEIICDPLHKLSKMHQNINNICR